MQLLMVLLLRFTVHAVMRPRFLRAIISPRISQVPPDLSAGCNVARCRVATLQYLYLPAVLSPSGTAVLLAAVAKEYSCER